MAKIVEDGVLKNKDAMERLQRIEEHIVEIDMKHGREIPMALSMLLLEVLEIRKELEEKQ